MKQSIYREGRQLSQLSTQSLTLLAGQQAKSNKQKTQKMLTQATENQQTLRTSLTKNTTQSDRHYIDLDDSCLVYIHPKQKLDIIDEIPQMKIAQILKESQQISPELHTKIAHFFNITQLFNGDSKINQIISQQCRIMEHLFTILDHKNKDNQTLVDNVTQLRTQATAQQKVVDELHQIIKNKDKEQLVFKDGRKDKILKTFQRSNEIQLVNVQLEKRMEFLNQQIVHLQSQVKESLAAQLYVKIDELNATIELMQKKIYQLHQTISDLGQQISTLKQQELKYQMQIRKIEDSFEEKNKLVITQLGQIQFYAEQIDCYREQANMVQEDYSMLQINIYEQTKSVQKSVERIKLLQKRIDEMTVKRSQEIDAPLISHIESDIVQMQQVTKILNEDTTFQRYLMSSFQKNNYEYDVKLIDSLMDVRKTELAKDNDVELQTLRYNYPPFMSFLDKRQVEAEMEYLAQRPISKNFMGILRSIMDGMYSEFQKQSTISFQGYVVHWLSTYTIDKQKLIQLPTDTKRTQIEEYMQTFYLDLLIPRLDKVWEVIQFRHFLNDIYSIEELYFYLHARFLIRRGRWMDSYDAHYCVVHYMTLHQAEQITQRFMQNFDKINLSVVFKALNERVQDGPKGRKLVQSGLVLQLLLEIFRIDRNNRYKYMSFAFPMSTVTFKAFHKFVQGNFPKFTEGETADLWREVFMISNGMPNLNSFFVASSRQFIKLLVLPQVYLTPLVDNKNQLSFDEQNFVTMQIQEALKVFKAEDVNKIEDLLRRNFKEDEVQSTRLLMKFDAKVSPIEHFNTLIKLIQSTKYIMDTQYQINDDGIRSKAFAIKNGMQYVTDEFNEIIKWINNQKTIAKDQNVRLSRFQRYSKTKIIKLYIIISSVLEARLLQ